MAIDITGRHPATQQIAQWFTYEHLTEKPRSVSREICSLADWLIEMLPDSPEMTTGLRKLLEAKDCFIRVTIAEGFSA